MATIYSCIHVCTKTTVAVPIQLQCTGLKWGKNSAIFVILRFNGILSY